MVVSGMVKGVVLLTTLVAISVLVAMPMLRGPEVYRPSPGVDAAERQPAPTRLPTLDVGDEEPVAWSRTPATSPPGASSFQGTEDDRSASAADTTPPAAANQAAAREPKNVITKAPGKPQHPAVAHFLSQFPSLAKLPEYPIQDKFTVVMINYNRPNHLLWQLQRLVKCKVIHRIYVNVNGGKGSVGSQLMDFAKANPSIRIAFPSKNSLNNRFLLPDDIETAFCMSIDDDIEIQNTELEWAFKVAKQFPAQITGFFPRTVETQGSSYKYVIPHFSKKGYSYNVVLTGSGTFFDTRWLHVYTKLQPQAIRSYIDDHFNCEDIAFNMMMSNATKLPPVLVIGSAHTTKSVKEAPDAHGGLRTRSGHVSGRSECLKKFIAEYKSNPLVSSDFMAVPFTFDKPALRAIMQSTKIHDDPFWWPK